MDDLRELVDDLRASFDKQNALQEEANTLTRRLIQATAENSQELLELRKALAKTRRDP